MIYLICNGHITLYPRGISKKDHNPWKSWTSQGCGGHIHARVCVTGLIKPPMLLRLEAKGMFNQLLFNQQRVRYKCIEMVFNDHLFGGFKPSNVRYDMIWIGLASNNHRACKVLAW